MNEQGLALIHERKLWISAPYFEQAVNAGWALNDAVTNALRYDTDTDTLKQLLSQAVEAFQAAAPERGLP